MVYTTKIIRTKSPRTEFFIKTNLLERVSNKIVKMGEVLDRVNNKRKRLNSGVKRYSYFTSVVSSVWSEKIQNEVDDIGFEESPFNYNTC